jgi:hypothetical protein
MRSSPSAVRVRDDFRDFLLTMAAEYSRFPSLRTQEKKLNELAASLVNPFTLAVFGYMKTGKSSLINALIGKPLAITGTDEATATLNWIIYGDKNQEKDFLIHWKDRHPEAMPVAALKQWAGKSSEVIDRIGQITHLQLFACSDLIKDINIVDTPGVGTVAQAHTETATSIISKEEGRKADALLYVFPPVAKASDIEKLQALKKSRLPGSEPYNSIGVLHLWDGLESPDPFAEATRKATTLHTGKQHDKRIHDGLEDLVCDIIPVSAPLALAARYAPSEFLEQLIDILKNGYSSDWLLASELWDEDADRRHIRKLYSDMPWVSFTLLVRTLIEKTPTSVSEAQKFCLQSSGIERLEKELDRRFFLNAAVIKQRLTRVKAIDPINRGVLFFNESIELLKKDERHFRDLVKDIPKGSKHATWLEDKHTRMGKECAELEEIADKSNRIQLAEEERMNLLEMDLGFLEQMEKNPGFVEDGDSECIRSLLRQNFTSGESGAFPLNALQSMIGRYQHQLQGPIKRNRELFGHLIRRIQERLREA